MWDDANLKLKCQQCKYQLNTTSSSPHNILNKNNNIHGYGANKRQLKVRTYYMFKYIKLFYQRPPTFMFIA